MRKQTYCQEIYSPMVGGTIKNPSCICALEVLFGVLFSPSKLNSMWQLPQQPIFVICRIREQTRYKLSVNKFLLSWNIVTYAVSFGQFIYFGGVLFCFFQRAVTISIPFLGCMVPEFHT